MDYFAMYTRLADEIVEKLRMKIEVSGYTENLGQPECASFRERMMKAFSKGRLTYEQAANLSTYIVEKVAEL